MIETPTTPEPTNEDLRAKFTDWASDNFDNGFYPTHFDTFAAGFAAGRTQAFEEAARIADGCVTDDRLDAPDVESDARARLIAERIRAAAIREGHN